MSEQQATTEPSNTDTTINPAEVAHKEVTHRMFNDMRDIILSANKDEEDSQRVVSRLTDIIDNPDPYIDEVVNEIKGK